MQITVITELSTPRSWKSKEILYQKYIVEGRGMRELAVEFKAARETIAKQLKLFDIPIRSTGSNQSRKRGLAYGVRCQERETKAHKRELENIQKMRELRDKGFSYWKIADVFNSMEIPTKTRRGKWHAKTIQQILCK